MSNELPLQRCWMNINSHNLKEVILKTFFLLIPLRNSHVLPCLTGLLQFILFQCLQSRVGDLAKCSPLLSSQVEVGLSTSLLQALLQSPLLLIRRFRVPDIETKVCKPHVIPFSAYLASIRAGLKKLFGAGTSIT